MKRRTRIIVMTLATVAVTTSMVLARAGVLHIYVFYTLLILMHAWIFSRIGIRIYNYIKATGGGK